MQLTQRIDSWESEQQRDRPLFNAPSQSPAPSSQQFQHHAAQTSPPPAHPTAVYHSTRGEGLSQDPLGPNSTNAPAGAATPRALLAPTPSLARTPAPTVIDTPANLFNSKGPMYRGQGRYEWMLTYPANLKNLADKRMDQARRDFLQTFKDRMVTEKNARDFADAPAVAGKVKLTFNVPRDGDAPVLPPAETAPRKVFPAASEPTNAVETPVIPEVRAPASTAAATNVIPVSAPTLDPGDNTTRIPLPKSCIGSSAAAGEARERFVVEKLQLAFGQGRGLPRYEYGISSPLSYCQTRALTGGRNVISLGWPVPIWTLYTKNLLATLLPSSQNRRAMTRK